MADEDYASMARQIMEDGDFDSRISRALAKAEKLVPADETEGSDGFYEARREVALGEFEEEELAKMTASQITQLFGMQEDFPEDVAEAYEALSPDERLGAIDRMSSAPYMTDSGLKSIIMGDDEPSADEKDAMRQEEAEETLAPERDDADKSYGEIAEEIKNEMGPGSAIETKNALKKGRGYDLTKVPESDRIRLSDQRQRATKSRDKKKMVEKQNEKR